MRRVIFLCPSDNTPTGGIKVIYRHAEIIATIGPDAFVMHPFDHSFSCNWFPHRVRFVRSLALDPVNDFVVIPEIWAAMFGGQCIACGVPYAIMVQNGYLTHPALPPPAFGTIDEIYMKAELLLSISADTSRMISLNYPAVDPDRIVPIRYSVGEAFQDPMPAMGRERLVTFMPRKLAEHAARVNFALSRRLPAGWTIMPIHNMSERDCASALFRSSIFMSFSEFEGLPLPPLEAAIAGNLVVGYTGQGAKEYWDPVIFHEVQQGDLISFVEAVVALATEIDEGTTQSEAITRARADLTARYSPTAELESLSALACLIDGGRSGLLSLGGSHRGAYLS